MTHFPNARCANILVAHRLYMMGELGIGDAMRCPYCSSDQINKNGRKNGRQRWRCRDCLRTFGATTATGVYRLRTPLAEVAMTLGMLFDQGNLQRVARITHHRVPTIRQWIARVQDHQDWIIQHLIDLKRLDPGQMDRFREFLSRPLELIQNGVDPPKEAQSGRRSDQASGG